MIILIKVVPGVQSLKQKAHTVVDSREFNENNNNNGSSTVAAYTTGQYMSTP